MTNKKNQRRNKSKTYQRSNGGIRPLVQVDPSVYGDIRKITLKSGKNETGGLLLGEKKLCGDSYLILIKKATGPGANAEFSPSHFSPDIDYYKSKMRFQLYRNGLVYVGEWHKHPGSFDQPSFTDLNTMKEITSNENTKDVVTIITTVSSSNFEKTPEAFVKTDFFYYQRGMDDFEKVNPEIITMVPLLKRSKIIKKINLDADYILSLFKDDTKSLSIKGQITDNRVANFLPESRENDGVLARIFFNHDNNSEISLSNCAEDIIIIFSPDYPGMKATGWQLNDSNGRMEKIHTEIIDIEKNLFKRLGGLDINSGLIGKRATLIGLGSVGSTAAAQLVKAGVVDLVLIDPDHLEIHNIVRHLCDLNDLGRYKVDAVAERLKYINPAVNITKVKKDYIKEYGNIIDIIKESDIIIVSTDTPDSRNFSNATSVETGVPAVYISLYERARTGSVYRVFPGVTGCRNCVGDGRWGYEFIPGTKDYSEAENERDILFQPGLDTDISLVTMLGVKMAISTMLNPTAKITPDLGTNYLYWNGYPEGNSPMIKIIDGIGIPKNKDCDICCQIKPRFNNMFSQLINKFVRW